MKDWSEDRIDFRKWKRVPGNPFADYEARDAIALWSLWEMPSSAIGEQVSRGRPRGAPTTVRSVRLPTDDWERLEREAQREKISVNALIASRLRRASRAPKKVVTPAGGFTEKVGSTHSTRRTAFVIPSEQRGICSGNSVLPAGRRKIPRRGSAMGSE